MRRQVDLRPDPAVEFHHRYQGDSNSLAMLSVGSDLRMSADHCYRDELQFPATWRAGFPVSAMKDGYCQEAMQVDSVRTPSMDELLVLACLEV